MLVYIREGERAKVLKPPSLEEIPEKLRQFFDRENSIVDDMRRELDVHNECGSVYLIS